MYILTSCVYNITILFTSLFHSFTGFFDTDPQNMTLNVGDPGITLICSFSPANLGYTWFWQHRLNGQIVHEINSEDDLFTVTDFGFLQIDNVSVRHHGEYRCVGRNPCGNRMSGDGFVNIRGPVYIRFVDPRNERLTRDPPFEVNASETLTLKMQVFGSPTPEFFLHKQNSNGIYQLVEDSRFSVDINSITLEDAVFDDNATYRLWANNTEGSFSLDFSIIITGVAAPKITLSHSTLITPISYGEPMTITCSVPQLAYQENDLQICWMSHNTNTKVSYSSSEIVYQDNSSNIETRLQITNFDIDVNGNYTCVAMNSNSQFQQTIRFIGPPAQILEDDIEIDNPGSVIVDWIRPETFGAALSHYNVTYNMFGDLSSTKTKKVGADKLNLEIKDICISGTWEFMITAMNEFGGVSDSEKKRQLISTQICESITTTMSSSATSTIHSTVSTTFTTSSAVVTKTSSPSDGSPNTLPIAGGAAAGAFILILFVCVLIIVFSAYIILSRRGSKGAERQWGQQEEQIDNYSMRSMPEKSPEPHVNGIGMGLPSPIPAIPSYGPIYIDPRYEFPRENIELTDILYDGTFTVIYKATAVGINEKPIEVAIKSIKEEYQEMDDYSSALIMEMEQLAQLEPHPNIVGLIRVCSVSRPVYMVMEYMCHGDLLGFLRTTRGHTDMYSVFPGTKKLPTHLKLTSRDLLNIIRQVATGMQFLSEQKIVHGALRARNVLVGTSMEVKIFNIGAHNLDNNESFDSLVRWMAPEVFVDGLRTVHGDIWSFGILMWEVVTLGGTPYADLLPDDLYTQLISEMRLPKPQHCAQPVYDVMHLCWQTIPNHRPLFDEIYEHLNNLNMSKMSYLDLRNYNEMEYSQFEDSERQLTSVL